MKKWAGVIIKIPILLVLFSEIFFYPCFKKLLWYSDFQYKLTIVGIFFTILPMVVIFIFMFYHLMNNKNWLIFWSEKWFLIILSVLILFIIIAWEVFAFFVNYEFISSNKYTLFDIFPIFIALITSFLLLSTFNASITNNFVYALARMKIISLTILIIILTNITFLSSTIYCLAKNDIPLNYTDIDFVFLFYLMV